MAASVTVVAFFPAAVIIIVIVVIIIAVAFLLATVVCVEHSIDSMHFVRLIYMCIVLMQSEVLNPKNIMSEENEENLYFTKRERREKKTNLLRKRK